MNSPLLIERQVAFTTLTLNRPEQRNALNHPLLSRLIEAIRQAAEDPAQRVLVLRGAGKVFCAGLDLTEAADPEWSRRSAEGIREALETLATTRLVTVALVHGAAVAGGAGLMSACDFALATEATTIGFPEVRRGLVPALIMTFLRRQLRERDARELLLLGGMIDATEAKRIGLLNRTGREMADLEEALREIVAQVRQSGPESVRITKQMLRELWPAPLADDLAAAHAHHLAARTSEEAQEGLTAYKEKRPPKWAL